MFIEDRFGTVLATLIIAFSWVIAASALANEEVGDGPVWLWSDSAPYSNAAAAAFRDGQTGRGLRLAHKALANAEDKRDRLIAHHNLCVAYADKARPQAAMRHCQEARRLADNGFVVAPSVTYGNAADILEQNLMRVGFSSFGQVARR